MQANQQHIPHSAPSPSERAGVRLVILGAGESGTGAAILAQKEGFDVFVSDLSVIADKYKAELYTLNIPFEEQQHTEDLILNASEIIKSPGIPDNAPIIKKINEMVLGVLILNDPKFRSHIIFHLVIISI